MNKLLSVLLLSSAFALPAQAALKIGDPAPDFTAQASLAGKAFEYSLKGALAKGPVVVYFYPAAYTGGCNLQARGFAQNLEKFSAAGASVVGVSMDNIARLNEFSADPEYCAGKVTVASDADGKIAKSYDLRITEATGAKDSRGNDISHGFIERTTYVIDKDGKVAATVRSVAPAANVDKALEAVQQLAPTKAAAK